MNSSPLVLSSQNDRLYRIVEESLDAAFDVCNNYLEQFTDSKIFDVFDQIFPTAFVLNTGYWIFFVSNYGASLCVCGRFGIVCRHVRSKNHWIDLQPIAERSGATVFNPKIYGPVVTTRYEITVNYIDETLGYMIDMDMDLAYANMRKQKYRVYIQARYGFASQWYGAPYSIRFTPNPLLKEQYGKYFDKLRNHRLVFISKYGHEDLIVTPANMPHSCLLLISVNVPKHENPSSISATLMNDPRYTTYGFRDVSTQTTENVDLSHYANLLHEVSTRIWEYHDNAGTKFPVLDEYFKNAIPYTDSEFSEYPMGINDAEEYDTEFPEFNHKKSIYKAHKRKPIAEKSIPKPIPCAIVQKSSFKQRTNKTLPKDRTVLPNFEEAFLNVEAVAPTYDVSLKRKRGRPKLPRTDCSKSYSLVTKSEKTEKAISMTTISNIKQEANDASFTRLNHILEQSNGTNITNQVKDINFELDIIDQLIKEDSGKNSAHSC